jgi:hypothetical protein
MVSKNSTEKLKRPDGVLATINRDHLDMKNSISFLKKLFPPMHTVRNSSCKPSQSIGRAHKKSIVIRRPKLADFTANKTEP